MNDDFIKRHNQRPDPKFVERLYQKITTPTAPTRSYVMMKRAAIMTVLVLFLAAALTFTFSPVARATVQAIFTFNGVTVSMDDQTGKLLASGNTAAIVDQGDDFVTIRGEDDSFAGVAIAKSVAKLAPVTELLSRNPDLVLPNIPTGYTLDSNGQIGDDGSLLFIWTDAAGHMITYSRSPNPPLVIGVDDSGSTEISGGNGVPVPPAIPTEASSEAVVGMPEDGLPGEPITLRAGDGAPSLAYTGVEIYWEDGGYYYNLVANYPGLTKADLQAMRP